MDWALAGSRIPRSGDALRAALRDLGTVIAAVGIRIPEIGDRRTNLGRCWSRFWHQFAKWRVALCRHRTEGFGIQIREI